MILLSIKSVLLTMLKVREEQIHFWFCWCFPPTGPMHLISAMSLWAGILWAKHRGVLQLTDSTKWRTGSTSTCCQHHTSNYWANEEHGWHRIKRCRHQGPHLNQMTHLKNEHGEKSCWERLKTLNPRRKVKSVVIHIYPFCIPFSLKLFTFLKWLVS